jgi:hypothetical protein
MTPPEQEAPGIEPWPWAESDRHAWPDSGKEPVATEEELRNAHLEVRKKRTDQEIALAKSVFDAGISVETSVYSGIIDVAKSGIERTRGSADFVQKAAAAIGTIYGAILGVSFAVGEHPLPWRALIPAIFLGLAILCSAVFLAWLPNPRELTDKKHDEDNQLGRKDEGKKLPLSPRDLWANAFVQYVRDAALVKRRWLRAGVGFLAAGLLFLPAPYIVLGDPAGGQPAATAWPDPAQVAPGQEIELRQILYQAQVDEAASAEAEPSSGSLEWLWVIWAIAVFVAVLLMAYFLPGEGDVKAKKGHLWHTPPGA